MQRFPKKMAFLSLISLGAALSACHDNPPASALTTKPTNLPKGSPPATASRVEDGIRSLSCALGCCAKRKTEITNNQ